MPVQLDVRDVLDVAVRGQHTLLVLPAEERDLDLLALVLVGVVLHRAVSVYPREGAVPDSEADVAAVVQVCAPVALLLVRDPGGVGQESADRPAVQNHEDQLAGMACCYLLFHPGPHVAVLANIPATILLLWALYELTLELAGEEARGERVIAEMDERLAKATAMTSQSSWHPRAVVLNPNGYTVGRGCLSVQLQ